MLRRLHLILAALAMLVAPIAMQPGMATAAMPMDHREMAESGHCSDAEPEDDDRSGAMANFCVAMCSAIAPPDAALTDPLGFGSPMLAGFSSSECAPFLSELPTPPPKLA